MRYALSIDIDAPPSVVWPIMSDVERWPEWTASVKSVRLADAEPLHVGSRATIRQPRFPTARWTVTTLEPDRGFSWESRGPGLLVRGSHMIASRPGGSTVTLSLDYEGIVAIAIARLTRSITYRYLKMEAAGLKKRSEESGAGSGNKD